MLVPHILCERQRPAWQPVLIDLGIEARLHFTKDCFIEIAKIMSTVSVSGLSSKGRVYVQLGWASPLQIKAIMTETFKTCGFYGALSGINPESMEKLIKCLKGYIPLLSLTLISPYTFFPSVPQWWAISSAIYSEFIFKVFSTLLRLLFTQQMKPF